MGNNKNFEDIELGGISSYINMDGNTGSKRGRKPSTVETKSKRFNVLMFPSLYAQLEKIATMKRTSINDLMNAMALEYIHENEEHIQKYDEVFGEK